MNGMPHATKHLLIINVLCFFASFALPHVGVNFDDLFGLHYWEGSSFHAYQLVTYMFLHSGLTHIFFNMFALFMFGQVIENSLGAKFFTVFYFSCGIGAGVIQEFAWTYDLRPLVAEVTNFANTDLSAGLNVHTGMVYSAGELYAWLGQYYNQLLTVGASGAVFGLLVAFAMLFPNQPMYFMFIPVPIKAKYMMLGYALLELFLGVKDFSGDNVAHFAHLGGAIVGAVLIFLWKKNKTQAEWQ